VAGDCRCSVIDARTAIINKYDSDRNLSLYALTKPTACTDCAESISCKNTLTACADGKVLSSDAVPCYDFNASTCNFTSKIYYSESDCVCDTGLYPYTSSNCASNRILAGSTCTDNSATHYQKCNACSITTSSSCKIGDVYYSDGTCSSEYLPCVEKTPIGVVFMLTDILGNVSSRSTSASSTHGRIVALRDLALDSSTYLFSLSGTIDTFPWGAYGLQISGLNSYEWTQIYPILMQYRGKESDSDVYAGKANTLSIVNSYSIDRCSGYTENTRAWALACYPTAAEAAYAYYPAELLKSTKVGQHNWYLPAIGELMEMYGLDLSAVTADGGNTGATKVVLESVNQKLSMLQAQGVSATLINVKGAYYLSSTQKDQSFVWVLQMATGTRSHIAKPEGSSLARAVLAF
jgi:hypothetical protein